MWRKQQIMLKNTQIIQFHRTNTKAVPIARILLLRSLVPAACVMRQCGSHIPSHGSMPTFSVSYGTKKENQPSGAHLLNSWNRECSSPLILAEMEHWIMLHMWRQMDHHLRISILLNIQRIIIYVQIQINQIGKMILLRAFSGSLAIMEARRICD